jgi:hypothetical protein
MQKKSLPPSIKKTFYRGDSHFFASSQCFAHSMLQAPVMDASGFMSFTPKTIATAKSIEMCGGMSQPLVISSE